MIVRYCTVIATERTLYLPRPLPHNRTPGEAEPAHTHTHNTQHTTDLPLVHVR